MLENICSAIKDGRLFPLSNLSVERIQSTSDLLKPKAEEAAAKIAEENKYPVVIAMFKDGKNTGNIRLMSISQTGIGPSHPQYVRSVPNTDYCVIRSEKAV